MAFLLERGQRMTQLLQSITERDHACGPNEAPAVLLEYGDYECPYCGRAHYVVKAMQKHLGPSLQFVFRNFPLPKVHPNAELAAEAAEAAGAQGRFWEMHDALFDNQAELGPALCMMLGRRLELDMPRFVRDLNEHTYRNRVRREFAGGIRSGVYGIPTFFINGVRFENSWDTDDFTRALQLAARRSAASRLDRQATAR
jgi:protein-disulfide isomerase